MRLNIEQLKQLAQKLDKWNERIGKVSASFMIAIVGVTFFITVLRYGFRVGSVALQESVIYMHASAFLLTAAYALRRHYHVRVDLYYSHQPARRKAQIDIIGTIFLLFPVTILWFLISIDYVWTSWKYWERSIEAAGLPGVFLLKTLILLTPLMLIFQGIADIIRHMLFLKGYLTEEEWK